MDEPCDWEVCTEATTPGTLSQLFPRAEKRRTKSEVPTSDSLGDAEHRKPKKTHPAPRQAVQGEETATNTFSAKDAQPQTLQVMPTRKELQDALPKIPPLSSFKNCGSRFMTFEEAEQDFHSFITTGLGRSVEIIREYRGREDDGSNDQDEHSVSVTLTDDQAQSLSLNSRRWKSNASLQKVASTSSSSHCDMEKSQDDATLGGSNQTTQGVKYRALTELQSGTTQTHGVPKPSASRMYDQTPCATSKRDLSQPESSKSVPGRQTNQTAPAQAHRDESKKMKKGTGKQSKKLSEKMKRELKRERDEEDCPEEEEEEEEEDDNEEEEEEEWSADSYWRDCYRAWNDYYSSMSPFQEQSYYSVAYNWMAAYRMNAVYMEELMKD